MGKRSPGVALAGLGLFLGALVIAVAIASSPAVPVLPTPKLSFLRGVTPFQQQDRTQAPSPAPWFVTPRFEPRRIHERAYRLEDPLASVLARAKRELRPEDGWVYSAPATPRTPGVFHRFSRRQRRGPTYEDVLLAVENVPPHVRKGVRHPRTRTKVMVVRQEPVGRNKKGERSP